MLVTAMLLSGCVMPVAFGNETQDAWCKALMENAPTASIEDTPQTIEEVADIGEVIYLLCEGHP